MTYYHGSSVPGLKILKPFVSEHKEPYIYFSTNPAVALLYAVHPVEKPFSWYPYGFDKDGNVVYTEYYPDAFTDVYKGRSGYLYECDNVPNAENPTNINSAYTCKKPVKIDRIIVIDDIYEKFEEFNAQGKFSIQSYTALSEKEHAFCKKYLLNLIKEHNLQNNPNLLISKLIKSHFTDIWEEVGLVL